MNNFLINDLVTQRRPAKGVLETHDESGRKRYAITALDLWQDGRRVAQLRVEPSQKHKGLTAYALEYANQMDASLALGLSAPVQPTRQAYALPGVIEQMLPQADLTRFPAYQNSVFILNPGEDPALKPIGALGVLAASGGRAIGHLKVAEVGQPPELPHPVVVSPETLQAAGRDGEDVFYELVNRAVFIPGVSGVRPKLMTQMADPLPHDPSVRSFRLDSHIVKIGGCLAEQYLPVIEHACLEAAAHAGVTTARSILSDDGKMLSVERFDLEPVGVDGTRRALRLEELCGLMGKSGQSQYASSMEQVALAVRSLDQKVAGWEQPEAGVRSNLKRLFEQMVVHAAIRNGDFHTKNWAILHRGYGTQAQLSPLYDVMTTQPFLETRMREVGAKEEMVALSIGDSHSWKKIAQRLFSFGIYHCQVDLPEVIDSIERIGQSIRDRRPDLMAMSDIGPGAAELIGKVDALWDQGTSELLRMASAAKSAYQDVTHHHTAAEMAMADASPSA